MSAPRRVVVDTDTGIDDACALLYLAGRPETEITAVTSVFGNCAEEDAVRNIAYVLRLLGLDTPVARGAGRPLAGGRRAGGHHEGEGRGAPDGDGVHGRDGLGDLGHDRPPPPAGGERAAGLLVRLAAERPGELDLLALGPMTNLALALRADPALFTKYRSVVVMAGSGPYVPPGAPLMADTNVAQDPRAARAVFSAPRRELTMVGVDVTATTILPEPALAALRAAGTPVSGFAAEILQAYLELSRRRRGRMAIPLHDPLAAGVLADPSLVTAAAVGPVNVVRDDSSWRAHLMGVPGGPPPAVPCEPAPGTRVVRAVDSARFVDGFVRALTRTPP
ncbi:nucleoside hydrolase [Sphaerisporangium fuscum]|uniref:nucleoside hydrolase n=1 Tax=Sphaerisporangium fuscum TaxID=2835868 RepID=UPI001BDCEBCC|nr:nucleoside hydrolase [Sphaerisporangium fuscum]